MRSSGHKVALIELLFKIYWCKNVTEFEYFVQRTELLAKELNEM